MHNSLSPINQQDRVQNMINEQDFDYDDGMLIKKQSIPFLKETTIQKGRTDSSNTLENTLERLTKNNSQSQFSFGLKSVTEDHNRLMDNCSLAATYSTIESCEDSIPLCLCRSKEFKKLFKEFVESSLKYSFGLFKACIPFIENYSNVEANYNMPTVVENNKEKILSGPYEEFLTFHTHNKDINEQVLISHFS